MHVCALRMHAHVHMCTQACACDVVGIRVWGMREGGKADGELILPDRGFLRRGKLLELIPSQKFSSFSETLPMQHNSYDK